MVTTFPTFKNGDDWGFIIVLPTLYQVGLMWWFGLVVWRVWEIMIIYIYICSSKLMMFLSCLLGHLIILFGALVHPKLISLI
jgi:hypothetical protein